MKVKICKACGSELPTSEFRFLYSPKRRRGWFASYCNACFIRKLHENRAKRARENKERAIKLLGGGCSKCGYNKILAVLEFHHIGDKDERRLREIFRDRRWEKIEREIKKCVLLCANCHRELHYINIRKDS